jgi:hypothetical protein
MTFNQGGGQADVIEFPPAGTLIISSHEFKLDLTDKEKIYIGDWEKTGLHSFSRNGQPFMANSMLDPLGNRITPEKMLTCIDGWDMIIDSIAERKLFVV